MSYARITPEVKTGQASFSNIATGSYADVAVTFSPAMSDTPRVCATRSRAGTQGYNMQLATLSLTKNGFTLRCWNQGNMAISPIVDWIAIV